MRKLMTAFLAVALLFTSVAVVSPDVADARRGGFSSGTKKFNSTPKKSTTNQTNTKSQDNVKQSNSTGKSTSTATRSGGGFMKGMMLGGLAGLMFGGLFGSMGMFGEILGLLVNVFAIVVLVMLVSMLVRKWRDRKKPAANDGRWNN
ncbi:hypothetical protein [Paenibacillus sp. 1001270B_150601_E10]|uniref:hypothetical protein n=1 Tax=Paenibacillus sp. 1001270B_150601_E10 TaxID=2787079 RepID=UPI0018A0B9F2|nr:hypothetical protein [Paenibacillus sp. 1001270B_150601_E10]